jgi:NDP-sugar pyrophosphorylase family protein
MKIVIPMAGTGARFVAAGYTDPKPLIRLSSDNRMIIEHVLDMFTDPTDEFIFICNEAHLAKTNMRSTLLKLRPDSHIIGIPPHKLGPTFTLIPSIPFIGDDEEVIVAYCDGTLKFDRSHFQREVDSLSMDGCLFTHSGFHPHTLSSTKMAFVREENGRVLEVKEKASFTGNPFAEHASSGVYYFRHGEYLKKYANEQMEQGLAHNGEFYVTLMYNLLIQDGLNVGYFDTEFFACLGTPEEVRNFEAWSTIVRNPYLRTPHGVANCYRYWSAYWNEQNTLDSAH